MTVATLTGARLSQLSRCPRQAAYGALGTPEDETPVDMALYFRRGHFMSRLRHLEYAEQYGADQVELEREIPWALGTGHADIYIQPTRTIVEVVSTVSPSALIEALKIDQAKTYVVLDPEAERAVVDVINPSSLAPAHSIPVRVADDDEAEVHEKVAQVVRAVESGGEELPARVCERPSQARSYLCPFASTCFAGWQEPEHDIDSPEARRLAAELLALDRARREAKAVVSELDGRWRDVTGELAEIVPAGKTHLGAVTITRTPVAGRVTFGLSTARKAGYWTPEDEARFEAFLKRGEPHERWSVVRDGEGPLVDTDDYGEVPF